MKTEIKFELTNNHIFVPVAVNGQGPYWFIYDSGASASMVNLQLAKSLGLKIVGQIPTGGGGGESQPAELLADTYLSLPSLPGFKKPLQVAMNLDPLSSFEGRPVIGVLGYEFTSEFVVEVDYDKRRLIVHSPDGYTYSGPGKPIPITLAQNHPHVRAFIDHPALKTPVELDCVVDTGSRLPFVVTRPVVEKYRMLDGLARTIEASASAGIGGTSRSVFGRVNSIRVGDVSLKYPILSFSQDEKGVLATTQIFEADLGGDVLRRFKVILNYKARSIILEPGRLFDSPFEMDASGMVLAAEGPNLETFRVRSVVEHSPAAEADIRPGDIITSVDGRSSSTLSLDKIRELFFKTGRTRSVQIRREETLLDKRISPRRLV